MRTFLFQCSSLMMVILVYSSPIDKCKNGVCRTLLTQIKDEALNLSSRVNTTIWVPNISSWDKICVPHFFCLAEKVVKNINKQVNTLSRLCEHLTQYNNQTHDTHCNVKSSSKHRLPKFLKDVALCAKFEITRECDRIK